MQYPSRSEYCSSIRNPQFAFRKKDPLTRLERDLDPSLVTGKPVEKRNYDGTKAPWSASGSFAVVFKYETFSPKKVWALKCFCRSNFEVIDRYKKVLSRLKNHPCRAYFVEFFLLEEGIRVLGNCYPLVKMEWVEGENLKKFLKSNLGNKNLLKRLAELFLKLANDFLAADIAHGDLQHGNIFIVNHFNQLSLKLIDYDSLYFAGDMADDNIKGLSDYQHPLRDSLKKRCREIDFFSQLVIYISILALAENSNLWDIYRLDQREGLLFSRLDFQNPQSAEIFITLSDLPAPIPALANKLKTICQVNEFKKIPSLESVLINDKPLVLAGVAQSFEDKRSSSPPLINPLLLWQKGRDWLSQNTSDQTTKETVYALPDFEEYQEKPDQQSSPEPIAPLVVREQTLAWAKTLPWDPRTYKATSLLSQIPESKPAIAVKAKQWLGEFEKVKQNFKQTYTLACQKGVGQFQEMQLRVNETLRDAIAKLKTQLQPKPKPKPITWATPEVASHFDRSVTWCHQQRYRFPSRFRHGIHYFKDEEGLIHWTKKGVLNLSRLHKSLLSCAIPETSFTTKEVSHRLQVTPGWIIQIKTKYAAQFLEGSHYHIDARKRYYWTLAGIAHLEKLRLDHPPKPSRSKTKKRTVKSKQQDVRITDQ